MADPCEDMLQQLDLEDDEVMTTTLVPTTTEEETTITTTEMITTTTLHPHAIPLPFAFSPLRNITDIDDTTAVKLEHYILEGPSSMKRWSYGEPEHFNAIFAQPNDDLMSEGAKRPLVVVLHDGPHGQSTRGYCRIMNTLVEMGVGVLLVNYRGSMGMSDYSSESVIGYAGEVRKNTISHLRSNFPID